MKLIVMDENFGNPFPRDLSIVRYADIGFVPCSTEGYSHNDEAVRDTVQRLVDFIGLKPGQKTLDVGYGQNLTVAETMYDLGMQSFGIDSIDRPESQREASLVFVPAQFNVDQNGVRKYWGTIEELLHPDSQLKDEKFDLITFWGSWESGGYNFAIGGEMGEFRIRETRPDIAKMLEPPEGVYIPDRNSDANRALYAAMQENRNKILVDCVTALNPRGGLLVVSSRYAGHGSGFSTDQLPWEKRINLRLAQSFEDLGAAEIYLFGISIPEIQRQLEPHQSFREVADVLADDKRLFTLRRGVYESQPTPEQLERIIGMKVPLGRIDAVYGRFKVNTT